MCRKCQVLFQKYMGGFISQFFFFKKTAAENHCLLVETYRDYSPSLSMCEKRFQHFSNNDFDVEDKEHENHSS